MCVQCATFILFFLIFVLLLPSIFVVVVAVVADLMFTKLFYCCDCPIFICLDYARTADFGH